VKRPGAPKSRGFALAWRFLGANPRVVLSGEERAPGKVNYLRGRDPAGWRTGLSRYGQVVYRELWPGVDLVLRGRPGELKYEFRVRPGARVGDIRLAYRGARSLTMDAAGALRIETPFGPLQDSAPVSYQEIDGVRVSVDSRYVLAGRGAKGSYGFAVGAGYDPDHELIIDPGLDYSTFLGGSSHDPAAAVAVDAFGNAFVTGFTQSPNFPTTTGAFDRTGAAGNSLDAFVTKLNATGAALVYSTFLGGSNFEWGRGIAIDAAGSAYVTGQTKSANFPTTGSAFDRTFNVDSCPRCGIDQYDAFVTKLNPSGSGLVYSTFLGGVGLDDSVAIALDGARNAYVTGIMASRNFPTTAGAFDTTANGEADGFVTKLNATGSALVYSTLLGGADNESPVGVAVDAAGNAYVGGGTRSAGFPTTPGAFDTTHNGGAFDELFDAFVTKLNPSGSALVFSTFLGGANSDFADDFAIDGAGDSYVTGGTLSANFPTTPGVFDSSFDDGSEGFVAKLSATGSGLVYSTFLGEAGAAAVVPDADGNAWLAGGTSSPNAFTTPDAFDTQFSGGPSDAYVAQLNPTGSALLYATFLGGTDSESAADVALDPAGNVYVTGQTMSADFPTTAGAFDRVFNGDPFIFWGDAFVTKFALVGGAPPPPPPPVPAAPALVVPDDGAVVAQPVTFDWTDVAAAVSYTIQVDEIPEFGAPLIMSAGAFVSQFTTSSLPDGNWFWRVRGVNSAGTPGAWSAVRAIQVQSAPPPPPPPVPDAPALVSPADNAQVTQPFTFDWSDVAAAAWYTIEVDDTASFAAPLVWAATSTPSELVTSSLPSDTLFWRVQAFNSDGVGGPFSAVRTVQVQPAAPPPGPLPAPSLLSPAHDARFPPGTTIAFDWSDVAGAATYTIQIDDSDTFSAPFVVNETVGVSQFTSTPPTTRMWWRVRANDVSGAPGSWSAVRRFELRT
jgi:Beta-propeller repeat